MKFQKGIIVLLVIVMVLSTFVPTVEAYPTNFGKWKIDYVNDLVSEYGLFTEEEVKGVDINQKVNLDFVLKTLSRYHYLQKNKKASLSSVSFDYVAYSKSTGILGIPNGASVKLDLTSKVSRAEFLYYVINAVNEKEMVEINNISDGIIPDIANHKYKDSIYAAYRYGLICGVDKLGTFIPNRDITYNEVFIIMNRLLNANLRQTVSLYQGDEIVINTAGYPKYYKNETKGLEITITKERYYQSDCYIANIKLTNPAHIKTIYSDGRWTNLGCEISTFDKRVQSIFMVNGDFRNAEYGAKLGIVRNSQIVNDNKFNGVLGMDKKGNLVKVTANNAQTVLNMGIRDTWTFGPWLVENGKALNLDNETKHPRTFIGQVKRNDGVIEYVIVVADGRMVQNAGLTNLEMANILVEKNCYIGYNLDGGGSSAMMFMGQVLNYPCYGERADIDYIYIK